MTFFPALLTILQGSEESLYNQGILDISKETEMGTIWETVLLSTFEKLFHIDFSQSTKRAIKKSHNVLLDGHLYFLYFRSIWLMSERKLTEWPEQLGKYSFNM